MKENLASARKPLLVVAVATASLLLVPLVAMRFTDEVKWDPEDFVFAGLLLFGAGSAFVLVSRRLTGFTYKAAVGLAVGASLFLVWANAAVGLMGSENHPANLMYGAVIGVGFLGAAIARLEPRGLARTMLAMALVQVLVPVLAGVAWNSPGIPEAKVIGVTGFFVTLFVISALLFRHAAGPKFKNQGIP